VMARTLTQKTRMESALAALGWTWPAAYGNFVLAEVGPRAPDILAGLRVRNLFVRYWNTPELRTSLRITVGAPSETDALIAALRDLVPARP